MKWYADRPLRFARQVVADVLVVAWVWFWTWLGFKVHDTIEQLRGPGDGLVSAGTGLRDTFRDAANTAGGVPLVGQQLAAALGAGTTAGSTLVEAGQGEVGMAENLALWLTVALVTGPVLVVVAIWLPLRVRYARSAGAVHRLSEQGGCDDLLALRALSHLPIRRLSRISDDPAGDWRKGRRKVITALAEAEQNGLGLRQHR